MILFVESQKVAPQLFVYFKVVLNSTYTLEIDLTRESRIQQPHENSTLHHFERVRGQRVAIDL